VVEFGIGMCGCMKYLSMDNIVRMVIKLMS